MKIKSKKKLSGPLSLNEQANRLARLSLSSCKRLVIKIGTSSLTNSHGTLNLEQVQKFTKAIADLKHSQKREILIVTSGAIGAGVGSLGFTKRPTARSDY